MQVWRPDRGLEPATRDLAAEVPVALAYNGKSHVVMMASPANLLDFAIGFSIAEGIVTDPAQLEPVQLAEAGAGFVVRMRLPAAAAQALGARSRSHAASTSCGLCGLREVDQALRPLTPLPPPAPGAGGRFALAALHRAIGAPMLEAQMLHRLTGAVHAAAFLTPDGEVAVLREDVGRHTALDKMIGAVLRAGRRPAEGAALMTSRCSLELVQKCVTAGIGVLVTVSAPTALAARMADAHGLSLVALARRDSMLVITDPGGRLTG